MNRIENKKIIVFEDDELNLKLFYDLLNAKRAKVMPLKGIEKNYQHLFKFQPDLIVTDIVLHSNENRVEEVLNFARDCGNVPVVGVSAYYTHAEVKGKYEFVEFMEKPVSVDEFYQIIENVFKEER